MEPKAVHLDTKLSNSDQLEKVAKGKIASQIKPIQTTKHCLYVTARFDLPLWTSTRAVNGSHQHRLKPLARVPLPLPPSRARRAAPAHPGRNFPGNAHLQPQGVSRHAGIIEIEFAAAAAAAAGDK